MFWALRRTLLKMIATYEGELARIAGKPEKHRRVVACERRQGVPADGVEAALSEHNGPEKRKKQDREADREDEVLINAAVAISRVRWV
jgi:hypothetical protein